MLNLAMALGTQFDYLQVATPSLVQQVHDCHVVALAEGPPILLHGVGYSMREREWNVVTS